MRVLLGTVALLLLASPLHAEEAADHAKERDPHINRKRRAYVLMQEGKSRFDLGKFDEAIDLCQKAFEIYPYPEALYNMAQAYRMKKDYERAIFFYKSYLRNEPRAPNRAAVEARIEELERLDAEQKASAGKPPQGTREPPPPVPVVKPPIVPLPPPPRVAAEPWYHDRWGWALTGGGAIALTSGVVLLPGAYSLDHDYPPGDQLRQREETADARNKVIGWALAGVGGVALTLGVLKLADVSTDVRAPVLIVGDCWIGVTGTF